MNRLKQTKRFLVLIFIVFFTFSCQKENIELVKDNQLTTDVSKDLANKIALNFSKTKSFWANPKDQNDLLKSTSTDDFTEKEVDDVFSILGSDDNAAFYIFTFKPSGFVIISATKKEEPILAYSTTSHFNMDSLPLGLQMWIDVRTQRIQEIKESDVEIPEGVKAEWDKYVGAPNWTDPETGEPGPVPNPNEGNYTIEKILPLNTKWGQKSGYNALLDEIDGQLPPSGCVAIAMAQVMKYHQFPSSYNWAAMPNTYATNTTAQLIKDIGSKVGMNYGLDGSGADTKSKVPPAFKNFGYSSSVRYSDYSSDKIKSEIDANRPVIFKGGTKKYWAGIIPYYADGHAWVCYGYHKANLNGYGYFRMYMNWGWYGSYDGWYSYNSFNNGNGSFNYKVGTIIGIKP